MLNLKSKLLMLLLSITVVSQANNLQNFNDNWYFTESDSRDYSLTNYNVTDWRMLDLPHDWTIEHGFDKNLEGCTAFTPGGIGWYSKVFKTPINENQKCYIIFDGVYNNAEFWLNGIRIGNHPFGYAPIYYDLTDILMPQGQENRILVRVDRTRYADSRWYTGSGIYRNVQLLTVDKMHIPVWGTFITTPEVSRKNATVQVEVELKNDYKNDKTANVITDIYAPNNTVVATATSNITLASGKENKLTQKLNIKKPSLWGVEAPNLYVAKTRIEMDGEKLEERTTRFGVRTIRFDKDKGFFLNGENIKIKGHCLHHDAGIVGAAVPKDVWRRRLVTLKEGGANAIRTAHNPASDEFLDLCDELGLLVQSEFYDEWDLPKDKRYNMHDKEIDYITRGHSEHFQLWAEIDLKNVMRSSRNHPSIFQWSIGNEIEWTYPGNRGASGIFKETNKDDKMDWTLWRTKVPPHTPEEVREFWANFPEQPFDMGETAKKLSAWTREMDTTRPITANLILPTSSFETDYAKTLDVIGFSYKPDKYDYFKKIYPDKPMMGTENVVRWYEWKACVERDFIAGVFLWTGVDYMGECRKNDWPVKALPMAPLDLAAFPRGSFFMYKSLWVDEPVLEIYSQTIDKSIFKVDENGAVVSKKKDYWKLAPRVWQPVNPFWNYNTGDKTIVEIYSNCESVELFQNGKSLGKQYLNDLEDRTYKWAVDYKDGKLVAKGMKNGKTTTQTLETVGKAVAIRLTPDKSKVSANNTDVVHVVAQFVDKKGREVKNFDADITFEIEGAHRFLGTDCGNTAKMDGFKSHTCPTDFGKCLLMIQATKDAGNINITAKTADNLDSKTLTVIVE